MPPPPGGRSLSKQLSADADASALTAQLLTLLCAATLQPRIQFISEEDIPFKQKRQDEYQDRVLWFESKMLPRDHVLGAQRPLMGLWEATRS